MKYLGIDYGAKRIGLAVATQGIAFPHSVVPNDANILDAIKDVIAQQRVESIVVGDTRSFGGHENPVTKEAEEFAERLKVETALPVQLVSEAGSSVEASRHAPEEEKLDDATAAFILQRYLDMH